MVTSFTDWNPNELYHFGTKGMKWGQRRFQNEDGSLTALGKERYGVHGNREHRGIAKDLNKLDQEKVTSEYRIGQKRRKLERKDSKLARKQARAEKSGNTEKAGKIQAARKENLTNSKNARKIKGYEDLIRKNKQITNKIIDSAKKRGLTVKSKQTMRTVNKGATIAKGLIATGLLAAGSYYAGKTVVKNAPMKFHKMMTPNGQRSYLTKDYYAIKRGLNTVKRVGIIGSGVSGLAITAGMKQRAGTKYKVQNKYRSR